ncbi:MAG: type IV secretory system conjugative DNA transfer family protein [Chitinophagaceae bacterium]
MDFSKSLISFSDHLNDQWSVDDAMKGVSIMGGTGSGKTTSSGKNLAMTYLKQGWGGLVLCAKSDEADLWRDYCRKVGREQDLIVFGKDAVHDMESPFPGEEIVFNPIDYEAKRKGIGGAEVLNITNIFMNIYRMGNRIASEGDTKEERYWDTALKRCLNRVIELLKLADEDISYSNMVKVINSSNEVEKDKLTDTIVLLERGEENLEDLEKTNFCLKCLVKSYTIHFAESENASKEVQNAYNLVVEYFTNAMPAMGSRTKSVVTESFMGLAEPFLSGVLHKHFAGSTNIFPELTFTDQMIIVLDFPIKEFLDAGIIAQCVFKLMFQQAVERRDVSKYPTPVFLWCDEAQYFVNPYDQIFLTTARSSRTATVFLSQNISNYFAVMGSGADAKARVDSLMGNLSTKIFHSNSDAETNLYASKIIGDDIFEFEGRSTSASFTNFSFSDSSSVSQSYSPQVQPRKFTMLKSGGEKNNFQVESIVFVTGKKWSNDTNYIETTFTQNFNS